jgi:AcrR family transcriptional regulator
MTDEERGRGPGRPRDTSIDARVVDATRELLAEVGFTATTISAIAARSGVPGSTIYRRWPSRIQLIEAAAAPPVPQLGPPTGDLGRDLRRFEDALREAFASPLARAALPGLLAAYQEGQPSRPADERLRDSWRPAFYAVLDAAGPEVVDPTIDPDDVFDLLLGSLLVHSFVPTWGARRRRRPTATPLLLRALRPPAGA